MGSVHAITGSLQLLEHELVDIYDLLWGYLAHLAQETTKDGFNSQETLKVEMNYLLLPQQL
eukprot:4685301-Amphidinium_carterae.1